MKAVQREALKAGAERVAAWADLLDRINVFPVADGDTGRNLVFSLSPFQKTGTDANLLIHDLQMAARGNSGNIAARFFAGFLGADGNHAFAEAAAKGRDEARLAVRGPRPGTMLTVFDALAEDAGIDALAEAVAATREMLPALQTAGVVDAGALGMFIFWEAYLRALAGEADGCISVAERFAGRLEIAPEFREEQHPGHCIQMVIRPEGDADEAMRRIGEMGDHDIVSRLDEGISVHFHAPDADASRREMERLGTVVRWESEDMGKQVADFMAQRSQGCIHVMTDGAGSLTREVAGRMGITLLNSYIQCGDRSLPETFWDRDALFDAMRSGARVSTAQASVFERNQHYQKAVGRFDRVVYLCVGSVYTGNFETVSDWREANDTGSRMTVIDTGAASGRLGLAALAAARFAAETDDPEAVIQFAADAVERCEEYLFLDRLHYLAMGGRLSKTGAFFGDLLHMKPVITPTRDGVKKAGVVRNREAQLAFAMEKMGSVFDADAEGMLLLEYTDNREWVTETAAAEIGRRFPKIEIIPMPLSLTSAVHMGPGTWGAAFLKINEELGQ